jgi:hypothetical protein
MTLFEIADVLWRRGEFEAYNALVKHAREYTTLVECGLTLLSKSIVEQAVHHEILTDLEADLQLYNDRRAEAYMRACERDSPNSLDFDALTESIYEQLCEENWHAA